MVKIEKQGVYIVIIILLLISLMGCSKSEKVINEVKLVEYQISEGKDIKNKEVKSSKDKKYNGMMGIPVEKNCPVVFILHGAHALEGEKFTKYYKGFEFLVKELANKGYLAISLDINNAYTGDSKEGDEYTRIKNIFRTNYDQLLLANNGQKIFPYDLKGKVDTNRINLIGHSRGGDNITQIVADKEFRNISFTSALKIAAAGNSTFKENYADIPTALIYSQYDEDVMDLSSARYYYYAYENDLARRTPIISAFLYGANHVAYNTLVKSTGLFSYGDEVTYLKPEIQREFTKKFTVDFLDVYNKEEKLLDKFNNETAKRYGIDFMLEVYDPNSTRALKPDEYMRGIKSKNMTCKYVVSSDDEKKDTAGAFNPPGIPENIPLYKISWEKSGGSVEIPLDAMFYGINNEKILSLYMALDSTNVNKQTELPITFDFILTDAEGKSVAVPYSSNRNNSLKYQQGKIIKEEGIPAKWQYFTPFGTELIELKQFKEKITIDNITSLKVVPTSKKGAIMLAGIDVYQK